MIKLDKINKIYDTGAVSLHALKDITLKIMKGEFTAVMGASGSGKSTMMNIIGCLDRADSGEYLLNGSDIMSMNDNSLAEIRNKEIGFVFQSFNLLPKLSVLENVELPMYYARVPGAERRKRAMESLEKVGLADWKEHRPNEISGGQKQRVAIARALVNRPALILADEPTGNLDSKSGAEVMEIFNSLNSEGTTIVLVTHEAGIAAFAGRIVRFHDGTIISDVLQQRA